MKYKLERCYKCNTSKAILKEIMFYGKISHICLDCHSLKVSFKKPQLVDLEPEYIIPYHLLN